MNKPRTDRSKNTKFNSKEGRGEGRQNFKNNRFEKKDFTKPRHATEKPAQNNSKKESVKFDLKKIKLNGNKTICSFVILTEHDFEKTIDILQDIASESIENIIISIPLEEFSQTVHFIEQNLQNEKEKFTFISYSKSTSELKSHNKAFKIYESDIFFVTNSSMAPREYSIEILRKYLSREHSVAVVPTVYNEDLEIQKYCLRFPSLITKLKCLFGCKKTEAKLCMMERGDVGYYKIHRTDISLSQSVVVNSAIFKAVKMFPTHSRDTKCSTFSFYKKLSKYGTTLFVPTARFIEIKPHKQKCCFFSKACYFLKNVF